MSACDRPLSDAAVLDWWTGELGVAEARELEQHLLSCGPCAARTERALAVAEGVRRLVRAGRLLAVLDPAVVARLRREGRRIREYRVQPGGGVQCTVAPDDDVVLARLAADLGGVSRVDLVSRIGDGPELRLADLPFNTAEGELILAPPADELRARPQHVERMRLLAVEPQGERLLGEYTFNHTPWQGP